MRAQVSKADQTQTDCIRVLVADDHPVVRAGIVAAISRQADMRVVAEAQDGQEAVMKVLSENPDVCLLDIQMPLMDGIEAALSILDRRPGSRLVILSTYETQADVTRALQGGAHGYVLKERPVQEIVQSLRTVASGGTWMPSYTNDADDA